MDLPEEARQLFEEAGLPVPFQRGKRWTVEEIEHDIVDVAVSLMESLQAAEDHTENVLKERSDGPQR